MRRVLPLALLVIAGSLPAQSVFDASARLGPQFMQYKIKSPINQTIPGRGSAICVLIPISDALTLDVGTAWAQARVQSAGASTSELSGLTDTQVRANYTIGTDFYHLPRTVCSHRGAQLAHWPTDSIPGSAGGGHTYCQRLLVVPHLWLWHWAGSHWRYCACSPLAGRLEHWPWVRASSPLRQPMIPFRMQLRRAPLRFQPGNEYRARVGVDRPVGTGHLSLGVTCFEVWQRSGRGIGVQHRRPLYRPSRVLQFPWELGPGYLGLSGSVHAIPVSWRI